MDKVMLVVAIVASVFTVIAGRQIDVHRRRIAELESELEDTSQQQRPDHQPDSAGYKRGT